MAYGSRMTLDTIEACGESRRIAKRSSMISISNTKDKTMTVPNTSATQLLRRRNVSFVKIDPIDINSS